MRLRQTMQLNRRQFVTGSAALALAWRAHRALAEPQALAIAALTPFADPLPLPAPWHGSEMRLRLEETEYRLHRDLPPTRGWTFAGSFPGPVIEARCGDPLSVQWESHLPRRHFLPIDHTLEGAAANLPEVRSVVHLHGARVPASSDGFPEDWITPGGVQHCTYPNRQEAALLFYHDHAMGISRLNVYAGLFGLYLLRSAEEAALGLPGGAAEIPLVLCDRLLTRGGQLLYPVSGIPGHPWVPEVYGNAVLVNGKLLPFLDVEPRAYRFRLLNAANSRFFRLSFAPQLPWCAIGCDQGLLAVPVELPALLLAPAERSDAIVDFSRWRGRDVDLRNDVEPILRLRVGKGKAAPAYLPPARLRELPSPDPAIAVRTRRLTLDEFVDLGANPSFMLLDDKRWRDPVTERPKLGATEIWELVNLTDDTHPIHLHQVRFRILDRRPFDQDEFLATQTVRYLQPPRPPQPEEAGWKDTVRATGGAVTRILVSFEGYAGRYLWHCHVLEHEANAMMRPYEIEP